MDKIKTSVKRKPYAKNIHSNETCRTIKPGIEISIYDPTEALLDEERIGRAIWECLKNGDAEGVIEVIQIHLRAYNKVHAIKETQAPKSTAHHSFKSKNPTIRTLAKLVHACI